MKSYQQQQSCGQMKSQETTDQMNASSTTKIYMLLYYCFIILYNVHCTQYIHTLSSGETESES